MTKKLKIAHVSDTHLGYRQGHVTDPETGRNQRSIDFERSFHDAVSMILQLDPDIVLHAGDVFHHPRPDWRAVRCFIDEWRRFAEVGIPSVVISGNHDVSRLRTIGTVYDVLKAALPQTTFVAGRDARRVFDRLLNLDVVAVPWAEPFEETQPTHPDVEWQVLLSHGGVKTNLTDPDMKYAGGDPWFDPSKFDYVALGDHHLSYRAANKTWYSGSTERCGFSDERASPGWLWVELEKGFPPSVFHYHVYSRPMATLPPVQWAGLLEPAVTDVVRTVEEWGEPEGIGRIELIGATARDAAEVQRFATVHTRGKIWSLRVYVGKMLPEEIASTLDQVVERESLDVRRMFEAFVEERGFEEGFDRRFLERGLAALDQAIEAEREESRVEGG